MGFLRSEHVSLVNQYLDEQGLTFQPLRDEILDHLIGDLESQMHEGLTFQKAWLQVSGQIPKNHFKLIQQETMEAINKRFNISKVFTNLSIILLIAASLFKLMHLAGTTLLLFSSLLTLASALLVGSISGIRLYKEKQGSRLMLFTIT